MELIGKEIIVTGANIGIGYEAALALGKMGANITMVCRNAERGESARRQLAEATQNDGHTLVVGDLSVQSGIRKIAADILARETGIDVLLNNAGGSFLNRRQTADGLEMTFALNHIGYFLLTHLLLDRIKATPNARIVNVASGAHRYGSINFDDLQLKRGYRTMKAYGSSKLANILFTRELARRLAVEGSEVTANCLHPGVVKTNIGKRDNGFIGRIAASIFLRNGDFSGRGSQDFDLPRLFTRSRCCKRQIF